MGIFDRFKKNTKVSKSATKVKEVKEKKETAAPEKVSSLKPKAVETEIVKKESDKGKTNPFLAYNVLIKPLITEKATALASENMYAFKVSRYANKKSVKKAVKEVYGFDPISVNIINQRGKRISYGRIRGKKSNWKKAIVKLKPGEKLEIYEGV